MNEQQIKQMRQEIASEILGKLKITVDVDTDYHDYDRKEITVKLWYGDLTIDQDYDTFFTNDSE